MADRRTLSGGLATLVVVEVVAAVALCFAADWGFERALDAFVVSNA